MLNKWGMVSSSTTNGEAALATMSDAAGTPAAVAWLLADCEMPAMDGFTLVGNMRDRSIMAGTRVIMLTSAGQFGDIARCRRLKIEGYLVKPVRQAELLEAMLGTLGSVDSPVSPAERPRPSGPPLSARQLRILVAEDNVVNQKVLQSMLEKLDHVVTVVANGQEVLDVVAADTFDLVLMDVQMPVMDGLTATTAIRERERFTNAHLRIIAVTAHAMQGDRERFLTAGMDGYISKPIAHAELVQAIGGPLQ
jgi:CheY-like chemotaxis protein